MAHPTLFETGDELIALAEKLGGKLSASYPIEHARGMFIYIDPIVPFEKEKAIYVEIKPKDIHKTFSECLHIIDALTNAYVDAIRENNKRVKQALAMPVEGIEYYDGGTNMTLSWQETCCICNILMPAGTRVTKALQGGLTKYRHKDDCKSATFITLSWSETCYKCGKEMPAGTWVHEHTDDGKWYKHKFDCKTLEGTQVISLPTILADGREIKINDEVIEEQRFPVKEGGTIPWSLAEQAYGQYTKLYGEGEILTLLQWKLNGGFNAHQLNNFVGIHWRELRKPSNNG